MKRIIVFILVSILLIVSLVLVIVYPMLFVATGYSARRMCSCHFVEGRSVENILENDLSNGPQALTTTRVDEENKSVTSRIFGMARQYAEYRENLGCVLIQGEDDYDVTLSLPSSPTSAQDIFSVTHDSLPDYSSDLLEKALDGAFSYSLENDQAETRAVAVVYRGALVSERYGEGITRNTPLLGWSMTKSITNAMVGILVKEGRLTLDDDHLFEFWTDDRSGITVRDLMNMQSGLAFDEDYSTLSDATDMLFKSENMVLRAAEMPLKDDVGSVWYYSSGSTNILSGIVRNQFSTLEEYLSFPHERIFEPLNMSSALIEIDEAGNFVGSSYGFATTRDWAKFGLLYLNQGNWFGQQLLDTSWVEFSRRPASQSGNVYGAQFWLNYDFSTYPDVPSDMFYCSGFEGQYVFIIPSRQLVVVRMGLDFGDAFDVNRFLKEVINAFPETQ